MNSNEWNIDELVRKYADMVYRIAIVQTHNSPDADDIFQEVFLRLVTHIQSLESEAHIKHWLIRVTINCCHNHHSSAWEQKTTGLDAEYDRTASPEKAFRNDREEQVFESVERLPDKYRSVIHLFYYEELSVIEISQILNISESNVKTTLHRGRNMLKEMLKEDF